MLVGVLWLVGIFGLDRLVREQHREAFSVVTEPNHILLHLDAWWPFPPFVQHGEPSGSFAVGNVVRSPLESCGRARDWNQVTALRPGETAQFPDGRRQAA